jgi:magnesium transporter
MRNRALIGACVDDDVTDLEVVDMPVRELIARLRLDGPAPPEVIAVTRGAQAPGILHLARLVTAAPDMPVAAFVEVPEAVARADEPAEHVANRAARSGARLVYVVDRDDRYVGLVTAERLAELLVREHDEDMARLGGYRAGNEEARRAAQEPVARRLAHRLPWLLIGLVGAMASTVLVSSFEDEIKRVVLLSFFVPAVVYMADAVGTQTETVLIRALSAGVTVGEILRRELLTGLALGGIVAALFFPFAALVWGDVQVAVAVALALFAACGLATAVAMLLPALFRRTGFDPAFGSGPLATVIQDLLSLAVYFAIAVPLAT